MLRSKSKPKNDLGVQISRFQGRERQHLSWLPSPSNSCPGRRASHKPTCRVCNSLFHLSGSFPAHLSGRSQCRELKKAKERPKLHTEPRLFNEIKRGPTKREIFLFSKLCWTSLQPVKMHFLKAFFFGKIVGIQLVVCLGPILPKAPPSLVFVRAQIGYAVLRQSKTFLINQKER
jgi:hypothetical protein